jgi:hypothetical protein
MNEAKIAKAIARREQQIANAIFSTATTACAQPQEPLTLDTIRRMMRTMSKPETFLSTNLFQGRDSIRVEGSTENFTVAHPSFWTRVQHQARMQDRYYMDSGNPLGSMFGIQIIEIDLIGNEDASRREFIRGIWARLIDAIKVASVELPEWLKPVPAFSEHG